MIDQTFRTQYLQRGLQMLREHQGLIVVRYRNDAERATAGLLLSLLAGQVDALTVAELAVCRDFLAGELSLAEIEHAYDLDLGRIRRYGAMLHEIGSDQATVYCA